MTNAQANGNDTQWRQASIKTSSSKQQNSKTNRKPHHKERVCVFVCRCANSTLEKGKKQQQRRNKASGMTEVHEGREEETAKKEIKPESKSFWGLKSTTDTPVGTEGTGW